MNAAEVTKLLAYIAVFDNRNVTETMIEAWTMALHDIPLDQDVQDIVVNFYREAPPNPNGFHRIEIHHIVTQRRAIRAKRLENWSYQGHPDDDTDPDGYLTRYRAERDAVASGVIEPRPLPPMSAEPAPEIAEAFRNVIKSVPGQ